MLRLYSFQTVKSRWTAGLLSVALALLGLEPVAQTMTRSGGSFGGGMSSGYSNNNYGSGSFGSSSSSFGSSRNSLGSSRSSLGSSRSSPGSSRSSLGSSRSSRSSSSSRASSSSRSSSRSRATNYTDSSRADGNVESGSRSSSYAKRRNSVRNKNKSYNTGQSTVINGAGGGTGGEVAGVRGSEKSTIVNRKDKGPAKTGGGGGGGPEIAAISIPPNFTENALYFAPAFAQLQPGDRFITPLMLYNPNTEEADEFDLWLKYDPKLVQPEWVDDAPIEKSLNAPPHTQTWPLDGYVQIQGELGTPLKEKTNKLVNVHWRAVGAIGQTAITMEGPGRWPAVYAKGDNLLKPTNLGHRSLAEFSVGIAPPEARQPGLKMLEEVREKLPPPNLTEKDRVRLAILNEPLPAGADPLSTATVHLADVLLVNPQQADFDALQFRLRYDPNAIKILDADEDNYITEGINLFDGDFHKTHLFDEHYENNVDPTLGVVDYSVASATGPRPYPSGAVARIAYRVLRPGPTALRFEMIDPATQERVTDVSSYGRSLLGEDPQVARQSLHGTYLNGG